MPRRTDLKRVLVIGSGPIVIGQACEFDYSGTQACKALKEEGFEVVLLNSNPATIMTDPDFADRTYIEPVTPEILARIATLPKDRRGSADQVKRCDERLEGAMQLARLSDADLKATLDALDALDSDKRKKP